MKKIVFVLTALVFVIVLSGCTQEEPTGNAVDNPVVSGTAEIPEQKECLESESRPCMASIECQGKQSCENGSWGSCIDVPDDGCPAGNCVEEWECKEWISCKKGVQTRTCVDLHKCKTEKTIPDTIKLC
ncbi:MAG: hypothetical protein ABH986_04135 [archaeon]